MNYTLLHRPLGALASAHLQSSALRKLHSGAGARVFSRDRKAKRPLASGRFVLLDPGGYLLSSPGSQWLRRVGAEARSCRSLALRSFASLHPAQRALGSVMSQVKCASRLTWRGLGEQVNAGMQTKQSPCGCRGFALLDPGGYLLSRTVSSQVPSA